MTEATPPERLADRLRRALKSDVDRVWSADDLIAVLWGESEPEYPESRLGKLLCEVRREGLRVYNHWGRGWSLRTPSSVLSPQQLAVRRVLERAGSSGVPVERLALAIGHDPERAASRDQVRVLMTRLRKADGLYRYRCREGRYFMEWREDAT